MSEADVRLHPARDPLLRDVETRRVVELPVLGIATRFESNSDEVLEVVEEAFGGWRHVATGVRAHGEPPRVRIVVHDGDEGCAPGAHAPVRHLCPDASRVIVHSPGSVGVSDPSRRESVAFVTAALVADRAHFRGAVLEALTLALLSAFDRHPLHAAGIAAGGRAVLLAAPSGTGKSTMAYVAHAAGMAVLGDDHVWVQLEPGLRVWGWPGRVRLLEHATRHFPEIGRRAAPSPADPAKLVIDLEATGTSGYVADGATLCMLARHDGPAMLDRVDGALLEAELDRTLAPGFDRFPARHDAVARALAAGGGWRLTLSPDPHEALPLLRRMLVESDGRDLSR